ncbi:MAG: hypothetical protein LBT46_11040 [Planctomycetaceae bacterium]|jgi:CheY-like chemotaxis protein|nr:hypothetical protein [Planctomycetaceae bacterium]
MSVQIIFAGTFFPVEWNSLLPVAASAFSFAAALFAVVLLALRSRKEYDRSSALLHETNIILSNEKSKADRIAELKDAAFAESCNEIREQMFSILSSLDNIASKLSSSILPSELPMMQDMLAYIFDCADNIFFEISEVVAFSLHPDEDIKRKMQTFSPPQILEEMKVLVSKKTHHRPVRIRVQGDNDFPATVIGELLPVRRVIISTLNFLMRNKAIDDIVVQYDVVPEITDTGLAVFDEYSGKIRPAYSELTDSSISAFKSNFWKQRKRQETLSASRINPPQSVMCRKKRFVLIFLISNLGDEIANSANICDSSWRQGLSVVRLTAELAGGNVELRMPSSRSLQVILSIDVWAEQGETAEESVLFKTGSSISKYVHLLELDVVKKRMLIVGVMDSNHEHLPLLMNTLGVSLFFASNVNSAVSAVAEAALLGKPFDYIVLDMESLDLNSFNKIPDALREQGHGQRAAIIAVLPEAARAAKYRMQASGCDASIGKPINIEIFLSLLASSAGSKGKPSV